jgi:hypothetical protein
VSGRLKNQAEERMSRITALLLALVVCATGAAAQDAGRVDGWVVLPVDEYKALRARAYPPTPDPTPPPPLDATLTRVDYDLRVNAAGDSVAGQARLAIDVLRQGWASVQIPAGFLVRDARIDGRPAALVDGNPPRVQLSRPGRAILALDIVVPLGGQAGVESIALPASGSALSAVTIVVPRAGVDLTVTGGLVSEQSEGPGESRWVVHGSPGRGLTLAWKRKAEDRRGSLPLRARARVTELVSLGEDSTQVTASVLLDVTQGLARDVSVAIPAGVIVNHVSGAAVADWNVERGLLTVTFLEPIASETSVVLSGEVRSAANGATTIPLVRVPSAERETGGVAVDVGGPGEIENHQPRGLEPADPADLGDIISGRESPSMAAFRYTPTSGSAARSLTVNLTRYIAKAVLVANIEEAQYDALLTEDGKRLVRARYAVRSNQRPFLAVSLPPGATLWSASLAGQPVRPALSPNGAVLLPLRKGQANEDAPAFVVELLYLERGEAFHDKADVRLVLPAVDLPVSRTGLTVHYSPLYSVEPQMGTFRPSTELGPWTDALRQAQAGGLGVPPPPPPPPAPPLLVEKDNEMNGLLDQFRQEVRVRPGVVPIAIPFPSVGPWIFLAAELTPETQSPAVDLRLRATGGDR